MLPHPSLNQMHQHDSNITLNSPHQRQHRLVNDQCDTCSNCSRPSVLHGNNCHSCNNTSQLESGSICNQDCGCSVGVDHPSCYRHSDSSSYSHYTHSNTSSENSPWKEDIKSASSLSSSCSNYSHCKQNYPTQKPNNKKSAVLPTSATTKSLAATSNTSSKNQRNNNKQKDRCCCCRSRTHSRITVFFLFFIFLLGAIAAFFCWPRTPRVSMGGGADSTSGPDWWGGERQPLPPRDTPIPSRPSLRATWQINVTLDNRDNWIPTHLTRLDFVIVDSLTLAKFAWASTSSALVLAPGTISPLSLTFNVNYQAPDRTDPTFQNLYNACGPLTDSTKKRPALNVLLKVSFHIFGIVWTPLVTATPYTGGVLCPVK